MGPVISHKHPANPLLDVLYAPALGPDRDSWMFLIKRASLLLLSSVSKHPQCVEKFNPCVLRLFNALSRSTSAEAHLRILLSFVTPSCSAPVLGDSSSEFALTMVNYLLSQQLYTKIGHAITQIVSPEINFPSNYN